MTERKGLFAKYFVLVAGSVGLALLVNGVFGTWMAYREAVNRQQELQAEIVANAASSVDAFLRQIDHDVAWPDLMLSGLAAADSNDRQTAYATLLRQSPAITDVTWVDPTGHEVLRTSRVDASAPRTGTPWASDAGFQRAQSGATAYGPVYFRLGSEPYMTIASPSTLEPGWVTVVNVNLKFALEVVTGIRAGKTGLAYVVDPTGALISHPDVGLVLKRVNAAHLPQVAAALDARQADAIGTTMASSLSGDPVLTTHAPIPLLGWKVFVEIPQSEALAPLYTTLKFIVGFLILGIVTSLLASNYMARRMVRPIRRLQEGAAQIGAGQMDHVIDVRSGDELEALATQFNDMSARLKESYEWLEQKVAQRTQELVHTNEALVIAKEEAEEAHRVKSNFLATMNHEIRTPLTAMLGMAYLALHSNTLEKARGYMSRMHMAGDNLQGMINSVLDYSKLEADKVELECVNFDLQRLLESSRDLMGDRASEKGILLNLEMDDNIPRFVRGDQVRLSQVVNNLVSNAIKFTPEGEVTLGAEVRAVEGPAIRLHCWVKDSGIGMQAEQMKNMFRPFTQLDTSITRKYGGTGLGLTICKRLVELMQGSISVESEYGKGSVFHIELPLQLSNDPSGPESASPATEEQELARLDGLRILVAEDNPMNQEMVMEILKRQGATVVVADNGSQVLARLSESAFDLILMDYHMPELNGTETTRAIRAMPEHSLLPIIGMTASTDLDVLHDMQAAGVNDCVTKPIQPAVALATLLRWVQPRQT